MSNITDEVTVNPKQCQKAIPEKGRGSTGNTSAVSATTRVFVTSRISGEARVLMANKNPLQVLTGSSTSE